MSAVNTPCASPSTTPIRQGGKSLISTTTTTPSPSFLTTPLTATTSSSSSILPEGTTSSSENPPIMPMAAALTPTTSSSSSITALGMNTTTTSSSSKQPLPTSTKKSRTAPAPSLSAAGKDAGTGPSSPEEVGTDPWPAHTYPLPWSSPLSSPPDPGTCPLLCCFYAEFDIKVGPKICCQYPTNFMDQDIQVAPAKIQHILSESFGRFEAAAAAANMATSHAPKAGTTLTTPTPDAQGDNLPEPSLLATPADSHDPPLAQDKDISHREATGSISLASLSSQADDQTSADVQTTSKSVPLSFTPQRQSQHQQLPSPLPPPNADDCDAEDEPVTVPEGSWSIFDSCSEYIITGSELTGNIVNLSAHQFHVLSRPTMIENERYERNALLFAVGFVLRRAEDPRPFRPVLSRLAILLRDMEMESQFLSHSSTRPHLQPLLERVWLSLNCPQNPECNLRFQDRANMLNLKLFQPPKLAAAPVPDHAVPILLRRDWQLQNYEWDLSINWVSLHIDGISNARQISAKAEVDLEIVRACLRVLKHHGFIGLVDMFFYSNRYEPTERVASWIAAGLEAAGWQDAVDYIVHRNDRESTGAAISPSLLGTSPSHLVPSMSGGGSLGRSLEHLHQHHLQKQMHQQNQYHNQQLQSSGNENRMFLQQRAPISGLSSSIPTVDSLSGELRTVPPPPEKQPRMSSTGSDHSTGAMGNPSNRLSPRDLHDCKIALSILYGSCHRGRSLGEFWLELMSTDSSRPPSNVGRPLTSADWRRLFFLLDHRRFAIFGKIRGLLRRVHRFPYLVKGRHKGGNMQSFDAADDQPVEELFWNGHHQPLLPPQSSSARGRRPDDDVNRNGLPPSAVGAATTALRAKAAMLMDGRHCDDSLLCLCEQPLEDLLALFPNDHIFSYYATEDLP